MRIRAEAEGGRLMIESSSGDVTTITLTLPSDRL